MKISKIVLGGILSIVSFAQINAQYRGEEVKYLELGLTGGASGYNGDLAPGYFKPGTTSWYAGAFFRYNFSKRMALRVSFMQAHVKADDAKSGNAQRNLNFRSKIGEFSVIPEFNILPYIPENLESRFAPYIYAGLAFYKFKPEAQYNNQWVDLSGLGTEGQYFASTQYPVPYQLAQFAIPMGVGVKFAASRTITIGLELGVRKLFNDYLDDVSEDYANPNDLESSGSDGGNAVLLADRTNFGLLPDGDNNGIVTPVEQYNYRVANDLLKRGNADGKKDMYYNVGITISYNFLDGVPGFGSGKRGCPTF